MSPLAERLHALIQLLPLEEREELLDIIRREAETQRPGSTGRPTISDLPCFSGGKWLGGDIGRDEIYRKLIESLETKSS